MSNPPVANFQRAEFPGDRPTRDACAFCKCPLPGEYFRIGSRLACRACVSQFESRLPRDNPKRFLRALLFGFLAAIVGCAAYATFAIVTMFMINWLVIGIGLLIGVAMMKGSRGVGGPRYQIVAALLTYLAVSVAFVPIVMHRDYENHAYALSQSADASGTPGKSVAPLATALAPGQTPLQYFTKIILLLGFGLASPFLLFNGSIPHALLHLFILVTGMAAAWAVARRAPSPIDGPFNNG